MWKNNALQKSTFFFVLTKKSNFWIYCFFTWNFQFNLNSHHHHHHHHNVTTSTKVKVFIQSHHQYFSFYLISPLFFYYLNQLTRTRTHKIEYQRVNTLWLKIPLPFFYTAHKLWSIHYIVCMMARKKIYILIMKLEIDQSILDIDFLLGVSAHR